MKLSQTEQHRGHEMVESILYGPVKSRRYGSSLGINLLPSEKKICTFNCVYCQLGWTDINKGFRDEDFISYELIEQELQQNLLKICNEENPKVDHVVVSGNGEPTLHPRFLEISKLVHELMAGCRNKVGTTCFTNGTTLGDKKIKESLSLYDEACVKFDASVDRVGLPRRDFDINGLIRDLEGLNNLVMQACFMTGEIKNISNSDVDVWIWGLKQIAPMRIDLYTLSRKTPTKGLEPINREQFDVIAKKLTEAGLKQFKIYI